MPFGPVERRNIRQRAGFYCQICGEWHPPNGKEPRLDAHSMDKSHKDNGLSVCRPRVSGDCHTRLHKITDDPEQLEKISRMAAELNSLSMANKLLAQDVPEKRVRRIIERLENF